MPVHIKRVNEHVSLAVIRGFSLVELMVAMVLGLILLLGVTTVALNASQSYGELNKASQQLENGRYAMQVLRDDVRHAGFYGEYTALVTPASLADPCSVSLSALEVSINSPVQGYAGASSAPVSCLANYQPGTDVLVVRRASTVVASTLTATDVYVQGKGEAFVMRDGSDSTVFSLKQVDGVTPTPIRKYLVNVYYIRSCSDCSGSGDGIPTLVRRELQGGTFTTVSIAEGIEDMQLRYGLDADNKGGASEYSSTLAFVDIPTVVAVEINLLARAVEQSPTTVSDKTFVLDADEDAKSYNGDFRRHAFNAVVRAVNLSGRREI